VVGVRYTGYVQLTSPTLPAPAALNIVVQAPNGVTFFGPNGGSTGSSSLTVTFNGPTDGVIKYFEYTVTASITPPSSHGSNSSLANEHYFTTKSSITTSSFLDRTTTPAGAAYYNGENQPAGSLTPVWRVVSFDGTNSASNTLNNRLEPSNGVALGGTVFMVGVSSPVYTLVLSAPPSSAPLQITLSHPVLQFSPATITFAQGQASAQFSFTPVDLPQTDLRIPQLNVVLTGAEAALYDYSPVYEALQNVRVIPQLHFTSLPALYVDEEQDGLALWVAPSTTGFPYRAQASFVITVQTTQAVGAVYFEPSTFTFTAQSLASGTLSQRFAIRHVRPALFGNLNSYNLQWSLRFEGSATALDITSFVPLDAQNVILKRYNIQPQFPFTLDFSWQSASFNITRGPLGPLTFTPHQAFEDGQEYLTYSGAKTAGGRIVFEPPVIAFAPGQSVVEFQAQAIPGSDQRSVYYRVQWYVDGNDDDLVAYLDLQNGGVADNGGQAQFSTWHIAPASTLTASLFALVLVVLALVL